MRRSQMQRVQADQFFPRITQHVAGDGVVLADVAAFVEQANDVRRLVEQAPVADLMWI